MKSTNIMASEKVSSPRALRILDGGIVEIIYRNGETNNTDKVNLTFPKDSEGNDLKKGEMYFDLNSSDEKDNSLCVVKDVSYGSLSLNYEGRKAILMDLRYSFDGNCYCKTREYWRGCLEKNAKSIIDHARRLSPASEKNLENTLKNLENTINWINSNRKK